MSDDIKMTPETGMTDEEIAELEKQREAAKKSRLAPFKALRQRIDAGLRYSVANGGVTDEELLTMSAATPEWKPGVNYAVGDTCMHGGVMYVVVQAHTSQTGWEPGTARLALFRAVQPEGSTEWQPNTDYATGAECTYEGSAYTCLQGHTSQTGWEPPNTPALWKLKT